MENIITEVGKMLKKEKKRKEIGELFLKKITELLVPVIEKVYGDKEWCEPKEKCRLWLWNEKGETIDVYLRYDDNYEEKIGFYYAPSINNYRYGNFVQEMNGDLFWEAIQDILDWLPLLVQEIQKKDFQREAITDKIKNFVCDLELNKNK